MVCEIDGQVAAFAIAYAPDTAYDSPNYLWHADRFDDFLYLDRIAVSHDFRRRGIASALYDEMEELATPHGRMVCEINSAATATTCRSRSTRARGYREIGHLMQSNGKETVMMEKPL